MSTFASGLDGRVDFAAGGCVETNGELENGFATEDGSSLESIDTIMISAEKLGTYYVFNKHRLPIVAVNEGIDP